MSADLAPKTQNTDTTRIIRPVVAGATPNVTHYDDKTIGAAVTTLLAANPTRTSALIQNNGLVNLRVTYDGTTPSAIHGVRVAGNADLTIEMPYCGQGIVKGITETGASTTVTIVEVW